MQKTIWTLSALTLASAALAAPAARADLTVVQTTSILSPQIQAYLQTMTPQQRAQMAASGNPLFSGRPIRSVIYVHGSKTRADAGPMTYIVDVAARRTLVINRRTRTYTVQPYRAGGAAGQPQATVRATGQVKRIAGHPARRYTLTSTFAAQPGTVIQGEVWAAQDLPQPAVFGAGSGPFGAIQSQFHKVKGFPLTTSLAVTGSPMGSTTVQTALVSISKANLPASLFAVPAGYRKSSAAQGGMGM